jgi:hypothetical protein
LLTSSVATDKTLAPQFHAAQIRAMRKRPKRSITDDDDLNPLPIIPNIHGGDELLSLESANNH